MHKKLRLSLGFLILIVLLDICRDLSELVVYFGNPNYNDNKPFGEDWGFLTFEAFIGSPNSTLIQFGDGCQCELNSIDCLDAVACLDDSKATNLKKVHAGMVTRSVMKEYAMYWNDALFDQRGSPIGMATQFLSIGVFREWLGKNKLPRGIWNEGEEHFANGTLYPYCREQNLEGRVCFFHDFWDDEEFGDIENEANETLGHKLNEEKKVIHKELQKLQSNPFDAKSLDYLLAMTHIARITFNVRSHMLSIYQTRLKTIDNTKGTNNTELRVAMHFRRGDSCRHETEGYATTASAFDSPAQFSSMRLCYDTQVYIDALKRVIRLASNRHCVVYIATDHSQSLVDEIKTRFSELYQTVSWKYLDYSRDVFHYNADGAWDGTGFIESPTNQNKAFLGETAVADIWHLSHGQVFIGHLGSRFGKVGWWQATARHNTFVPFYTVDGHSICCDIDENCGAMAPYVVSMENCISIYYANSKFNTERFNESEYWLKGATFRSLAADEENKFRQTRTS